MTRNRAVTLVYSSRRHDGLADRPERDAGKLQMRPRKGKADDGDRHQHGGDDMAEREPPAGEDEPDQIADKTKRAGAGVVLARDVIAAHSPRAERQQGVCRDVEGRPRPGKPDDGHGHDDGSPQPAERHPGAAQENPEDIQKDRNRLHGTTSLRRANSQALYKRPATTAVGTFGFTPRRPCRRSLQTASSLRHPAWAG